MRGAPGVRYLEWIIALRRGGLRIDLTQSGLSVPWDRLRPAPGEFRSTLGGDPEIRARIAARYGVAEGEVVCTLGTSLGAFVALAASLAPGDDVLVEEPAYETLHAVPAALGAAVRRFPREAADGYAVDPDRVLAALRPGTRMVVVSDLHNPSGRAAGPGALARLAEALAARGVDLFVDEVYRDFSPEPVGTARRLGPNVLIASSLTKVYGLGPLRAGWVLASPDRVRAMLRVLTLLEVEDPAPQIPYLRAAWTEIDALREEGLRVASSGWRIVEAWLAGRSVPGARAPAGGICAWLRLPDGISGRRVAERLHREHGVGIVPGAFFGDDRGLRVGFSAPEPILREGLDALARVLAEEGAWPSR